MKLKCVFGRWNKISTLLLVAAIFLATKHASAEQCGKQANNALCENNLCCSQYGWCGSTDDYCLPSNNCQSQCKSSGGGSTPSGGGSGDVSSLITSSVFEDMLKHRNDAACEGKNFYTYDAFITAAKSFSGFGTTGDETARKRDVAAFFGQTSHETTGGWDSAPDGRYSWGYCQVREGDNTASTGYYGRGPIQLTHDYNYQQAGNAIGVDLVNNPDLVATDAVVSFKTAIWFWMTAQSNKPSCHDVMTNNWTPSAADTSAGRKPGYGVVTNIINGGLECGIGQDSRVEDRIGFYKRYCDILGVSYGDNLDCYTQTHF